MEIIFDKEHRVLVRMSENTGNVFKSICALRGISQQKCLHQLIIDFIDKQDSIHQVKKN